MIWQLKLNWGLFSVDIDEMFALLPQQTASPEAPGTDTSHDADCPGSLPAAET